MHVPGALASKILTQNVKAIIVSKKKKIFTITITLNRLSNGRSLTDSVVDIIVHYSAKEKNMEQTYSS